MKESLRLYLLASIPITLLALVFAGWVFFRTPPSPPVEPSRPTLLFFQGEVSLGSTPLKGYPQTLSGNSLLRTSQNGTALIVLPAGEEIELLPAGELLINPPSLTLRQGSLRFRSDDASVTTILWNNYRCSLHGSALLRTLPRDEKKATTLEQLEVRLLSGRGDCASAGNTTPLSLGTSFTFRPDGFVGRTPLLPSPKLISPEDQKIIGLRDGINISFRWQPVPEAASYLLSLSYDTLFSEAQVIKTSQPLTSLSLYDFHRSPVFWNVKAVDGAGVEGNPSQTFSYDLKDLVQTLQLWKTPPPLELTAPLEPSGNIVIVKGKTDLGIRLTINGSEVPVDHSGSFMYILKFMSIGEHTVSIKARNLSGAESTIERKIIIYEK